jgi:hypothetical protein
MLEDLEIPMFTQSQVLRMLPDMKAKTLQNWAARGVLDVGDQKPGKQGRRLYTPLGVIMLDFMHKVGMYGVPPERAVEMGSHIGGAALEYWQAGPEIVRIEEGNSRWIPVSPERMESYRKARIVTFTSHELDGSGFPVFDTSTPRTTKSYLKFVDSLDDTTERFHHDLSIIVEVDFLISQTINRMFLLEAGVI